MRKIRKKLTKNDVLTQKNTKKYERHLGESAHCRRKKIFGQHDRRRNGRRHALSRSSEPNAERHCEPRSRSECCSCAARRHDLRHDPRRKDAAILKQTAGWPSRGGQRKLNQPVITYFSSVGETTPRCICVQSAGQISVSPLRACALMFWQRNSVPPSSKTSFR